MALNREQRRAMLAQELSGGDIEVAQVDAVDPAPVPAPAPVLPTPTLALSVEQLQAIVTAAVQAVGSGGGDIAGQIAKALRDNRQPIPENTDAAYHGRSHYHPGGKDATRPVLAIPTFLGIWDPQSGTAVPRYPIEEAMSTDAEIEAINATVPGVYKVRRTDGVETMARVVDVKDAMDTVIRRVIAFPQQQFEKEQKNTLPMIDQLAGMLVA